MHRSPRRRQCHRTPVTIQITPAQSPERTDGHAGKHHKGHGHGHRQSSGRSTKPKHKQVPLSHRSGSSHHLNPSGPPHIDICHSDEPDNPDESMGMTSQSENPDSEPLCENSFLDVPKPRKSSLRTRSLGDIFDGIPIHVRFKLTGDNSEDDDSSRPPRRCRSISPFTGMRRDEIPTGSDSFQRIMYEMQSESETSRTDSNSSPDEGSISEEEGSKEENEKKIRKVRKSSLRQRAMTRNILNQLTERSNDAD